MSDLEVNATAVHPFFIGGRWIEVKDIKVGDVLTTYCGEVARVDSIKIEKGQFTVYNFSVEDFASYYVADPKVLVHNCPPKPGTSGGGKASNKLKPDPDATGNHTTIQRGNDGKVFKYETYEKTSSGHFNPQKR